MGCALRGPPCIFGIRKVFVIQELRRGLPLCPKNIKVDSEKNKKKHVPKYVPDFTVFCLDYLLVNWFLHNVPKYLSCSTYTAGSRSCECGEGKYLGANGSSDVYKKLLKQHFYSIFGVFESFNEWQQSVPKFQY